MKIGTFCRSSRWSRGNLWFPASVTLTADAVCYRKGRLIGWYEEEIKFSRIASIKASHGVFLSTVRIATTGGADPIMISGLWRAEALILIAVLRRASVDTPAGV